MKRILPNLLILLAACGGPAPEPVVAPQGWAEDPKVLALIDDLVEKARDDPSAARTHRNLGYAYYANTAWPQAIQSLQNALTIAPEDPSTRFFLAQALAQAGDLDASLHELEQLASDSPNFTPAHLLAGYEYLDRDQLDEAAKAFQAVQVQQASLPHGAIGLGEVALARGKPQLAVEHLQRALQRSANESYTHLLLGQAYAQLGEEERAEASSSKGAGSGRPRMNPPAYNEIERFKVSWGDRLLRAVQLLKENEAGPALVLLEALHAEDPDQEVALNNLAVAYMRLARFDEALATIDKALALKPDQHESHWNRASCYYKKGLQATEQGNEKQAAEWFDVAMESVRECLRISPRMPRAYTLRGKLELARKRVPEAIQAFRNAIVQGDTSEEVYLTLARAVIPREGQAAGLRVLQDSVAQTGSRMESRFQLVGMLIGMQRGSEARAAQQAMVELDPEHPLAQRADQALKQRGF